MSSSTQTFTVVDIRKAFEGFEADLRLIARRTEAKSQEWAESIAYDVVRLAEPHYLRSVHVIFYDRYGIKRRARKYTAYSDFTGESEQPGGNRFPTDPYGYLTVVLHFTDTWHALSEDARAKFRKGLKNDWVPSDEDTSHRDLIRTGERTFASHGYALRREDYGDEQ